MKKKTQTTKSITTGNDTAGNVCLQLGESCKVICFISVTEPEWLLEDVPELELDLTMSTFMFADGLLVTECESFLMGLEVAITYGDKPGQTFRILNEFHYFKVTA